MPAVINRRSSGELRRSSQVPPPSRVRLHDPISRQTTSRSIRQIDNMLTREEIIARQRQARAQANQRSLARRTPSPVAEDEAVDDFPAVSAPPVPTRDVARSAVPVTGRPSLLRPPTTRPSSLTDRRTSAFGLSSGTAPSAPSGVAFGSRAPRTATSTATTSSVATRLLPTTTGRASNMAFVSSHSNRDRLLTGAGHATGRLSVVPTTGRPSAIFPARPRDDFANGAENRALLDRPLPRSQFGPAAGRMSSVGRRQVAPPTLLPWSSTASEEERRRAIDVMRAERGMVSLAERDAAAAARAAGLPAPSSSVIRPSVADVEPPSTEQRRRVRFNPEVQEQRESGGIEQVALAMDDSLAIDRLSVSFHPVGTSTPAAVRAQSAPSPSETPRPPAPVPDTSTAATPRSILRTRNWSEPSPNPSIASSVFANPTRRRLAFDDSDGSSRDSDHMAAADLLADDVSRVSMEQRVDREPETATDALPTSSDHITPIISLMSGFSRADCERVIEAIRRLPAMQQTEEEESGRSMDESVRQSGSCSFGLAGEETRRLREVPPEEESERLEECESDRLGSSGERPAHDTPRIESVSRPETSHFTVENASERAAAALARFREERGEPALRLSLVPEVEVDHSRIGHDVSAFFRRLGQMTQASTDNGQNDENTPPMDSPALLDLPESVRASMHRVKAASEEDDRSPSPSRRRLRFSHIAVPDQ